MDGTIVEGSVDVRSAIEQERDRLKTERDKKAWLQKQVGDEIAAIDRELEAIAAYERVKTGKSNAVSSGSTGMRRERTGRRSDIRNVLAVASTGMTRGDIINALGLKGDTSGEMSVSNALTALVKSNAIMRQDGRYFLVTEAASAPAA